MPDAFTNSKQQQTKNDRRRERKANKKLQLKNSSLASESEEVAVAKK